MTPMFALLIAIPALGFLTGARSMTPMAVLCYFAWRGNLDLTGSWGAWAGHGVSALVFAVLALGEYIGDALPKTPNRTAAFPLLARIGFGGLVGALAATGLGNAQLEGILLGGLGALAGTFVTFQTRRYFTQTRGIKDLYVALVEDGVVIGLSVLMLGIVTG